MVKFIVKGGNRLSGKVRINGAKNAALPVIAASLLGDGESTINNIPNLEDVKIICMVLESLGCKIKYNKDKVKIRPDSVAQWEAPYELVRKMRASFLVMGPLLARLGRARISLPGGCAIGSRPIDLHLKGFQALGADIVFGHGFIEAKVNRLKGNKIYLDYPSVGATENIMMASTLAEGVTIIENAAEEPEIADLGNYLINMGARILGAGTDTIKIEGVKELKGSHHSVISDRIEAGTFMVAAAITKGELVIENIICEHIKPVIAKLKEVGVNIEEQENVVYIRSNNIINSVDIKTMPYPGFPTDMQSQMMALMSIANGTSIITETVFENRFMHVDELKRMGANIKIQGRSAVVEGLDLLSGAPVKATDLRAGAAMVLAGLVAEGETVISEGYHLDRGYENIEQKLSKIGAEIYRVSDE